MRRCISCGRIIKDDTVDTAGSGKNEERKYCSDCLDENGKLKTYEQVSESLAKYLIRTQGLDEKAAENAAKAIASSQPEWDKKQGVYFEKDMRKKKRLVVVLFTILALIAGSTGFWFWYNHYGNKEAILFANGEDYEITRMIGDVEVHELDIPDYQRVPKLLFDDDPNIFCFTSPNKNKIGKYMSGRDIYMYNAESQKGFRMNFIMRMSTRIGYSQPSTQSLYNMKNNILLLPMKFVSDKNEFHHDIPSIKLVGLRFDKSKLKEEMSMFTKMYWISGISDYNRFIEERKDEGHSTWFIEQKENIVNPVLLDDYIAWAEYEYSDSYLRHAPERLILHNPFIDSYKTIADTIFNNDYKITNKFFVWLDNRDFKAIEPKIYCYDIETEEEFEVADNSNMGFYDTNDRYILLSKGAEMDWNHRPRNGLYVFDAKYRRFVKTPVTNSKLEGYATFEKKKYKSSEWSNSVPVVMSEGSTPEETYVAWIEEVGNREEIPWDNSITDDLDCTHHLVGIQNITNIGKNPMRVVGVGDKSESQCPLNITSKYIVWKSLDAKTRTSRLWVGLIESGKDDGVIESIEIDNSEKTEDWNWFRDVEVSENCILWLKQEPYSSNICWAKISDIFPDKTDVAGMEE